MSLESLLITYAAQIVRPPADADKGRGEGRRKRDDKSERQNRKPHDDAHPVTNSQGQVTGKLIDIVA